MPSTPSDRPSLGQRVRRELARTARDPSRLIGYPRRLVRLVRRKVWPGSRATAPAATAEAGTPSLLPATIRNDRPGASWFIVDRAVAIDRRDRPVVVGALTHATTDALRPDVVVDRVTPDDALATLDVVRPDLVVFEAAAVATGPWAHAGDPAAPDRTAAAARFLVRARELGVPIVLVRDDRGRAPVALDSLERLVDLVVEAPTADRYEGWWRGVQLATFHPVGARRTPTGPIVHVAGRGRWPRATAASLEAALQAAADQGSLEIVLDADADDAMLADLPDALRDRAERGVGSAGLARRYRSASFVLADPPRPGRVPVAALEALACGTPVAAAPDPWLATIAGALVTPRGSPDDAGSSDLRPLLRAIAAAQTSSVQLDRLFRALDVDPPGGHRATVTAIVDPGHPDRLAAVVDGLLAQTRLPTEVIAPGEAVAWPPAVRDALSAAGVAVDHADRHPELRGSWLIRWPTDRVPEPTMLEDLLVGAAMRQTESAVLASGTEAGFAIAPVRPEAVALVSREALDARDLVGAFLRGDAAWLDEATAAGWRQLTIGAPGGGAR